MPLLAFGLVLAGGAGANAQEKGQTGLTLGYPGSIGVVWHVTDRVAVRPELAFSFSSNEVTTASTSLVPGLGDATVVTDTDTSAVGVGLSGLYYLRRFESLSTYVSPRFVYTRTKVTTRVTPFVFGASDLDGSGITVSASWGAQYSPSRWFSVFGEVGVGFSDQNNTSTLSEANVHQVNSRTGVGVLFYFGGR
jgi:hypothetical protein